MTQEERTVEAERLAALAQQYAGKGITEQDTKNAFAEPVLAMFGRLKHDLERVRPEYRPTSKYNPVDYALFDNTARAPPATQRGLAPEPPAGLVGPQRDKKLYSTLNERVGRS